MSYGHRLYSEKAQILLLGSKMFPSTALSVLRIKQNNTSLSFIKFAGSLDEIIDLDLRF